MNFLQSWRRDTIINIKLIFFLFFFSRLCAIREMMNAWNVYYFPTIFYELHFFFIFYCEIYLSRFTIFVCQSTKYEFRSREKKKNCTIIESCQRNFFTKEWENSTRVSFCREINLMHSPPTNVSFANDLRNFSS